MGKKKDLQEMLMLLFPTENRDDCERRFRANRRKKVLAVGVLCLGMVGATIWKEKNSVSIINSDGTITKPDTGTKTVELTVDNGKAVSEMKIEIPARVRTEEEIPEMFDEIFERIDAEMCADNLSVNEISSNLNLSDSFDQYGVKVYWKSDNNRLVRQDGTVRNEALNEPETVHLQATLQYRDHSAVKNYELTIVPRKYSEAEELGKNVEEVIRAEEEKQESESVFVLPTQVGEEQLKWMEKRGSYTGIFAVLGFLAVMLVYFREENNLKELKKKREEELLLDYPDFLSRFLLLIGSGMTARSAWERMAADCKKSGRRRFLEGEILRTQAQLEVGLPETEAYEQFGRRCAQLPYLRFATIVNQNLRKGSAKIAGLLEAESRAAFADRKSRAKERGEQAGTKLLVPMGGMLVLILAIILVPAFIGFQF